MYIRNSIVIAEVSHYIRVAYQGKPMGRKVVVVAVSCGMAPLCRSLGPGK
jgi:hypothetical protein